MSKVYIQEFDVPLAAADLEAADRWPGDDDETAVLLESPAEFVVLAADRELTWLLLDAFTDSVVLVGAELEDTSEHCDSDDSGGGHGHDDVVDVEVTVDDLEVTDPFSPPPLPPSPIPPPPPFWQATPPIGDAGTVESIGFRCSGCVWLLVANTLDCDVTIGTAP